MPTQSNRIIAAIRAVLPNAAWDLIKNIGRFAYQNWPLAVVIMGFIASGVTALINRLRGIPSDAIGILVLFGIVVLVALFSYVVGRVRDKKRTEASSNSDDTKKRDAVTANAQTSERVSTVPPARTPNVHAECEKRIAMLSDDARTHSIRADARDGEIAQLKAKYAVAIEMADRQAAKIGDFVEVTRTCVYEPRLDHAMPTLKWGILLKNKSVFRISLDGDVGSLFFENQRLTAEKEVVDNEVRGLWPDREGNISFLQRLTDAEAAFIRRTPKGIFQFDKVTLSVKGYGAEHVKSGRVMIFSEFRVEMDKCSDLQTQATDPFRKEVEDLKSQLKTASNVLGHDQKAERRALIASWRASVAKAYRDYQDSGWSFTGLLATQDDYLSLTPNLSPEIKAIIEDPAQAEYADVRRLVHILAEDIARIEREWGL